VPDGFEFRQKTVYHRVRAFFLALPRAVRSQACISSFLSVFRCPLLRGFWLSGFASRFLATSQRGRASPLAPALAGRMAQVVSCFSFRKWYLTFFVKNGYHKNMGYITSELINLFNFLLPGFITSFLFHSLTSFPKKSEFDKVVMALIYTIVINAIIDCLGYSFIALGTNVLAIGAWTPEIKVIWSIVIALVMGFLVAYIYNNDVLHRILRKIKVTNQTSYPSEWYGTFSETNSYIILHFTDGKRLMGYTLEWPIDPKNGHFILEDSMWLVEENGERHDVELSTVSKIMVDTTKIEMVEFLK
jgi:hypothetical protein